MASHEETLAQLQQGAEFCNNLHGVIQNALSMNSELRGVLQNALGNTGAYGEVAGYSEAVTGALEASAQATEQTKVTIESLMARFQGG